ncbi:glycosyltransferase [Shewanella abyssi]|uniref:glycosyltransferase n=1 Tax=Shewanella abyssi TaxID=311789 RepID=UPI002010B55A|nr:glycosyltransferase [Shewanella abyssi]MCL1048298.1 glycosyltransferase [Shewanella abyssi]
MSKNFIFQLGTNNWQREGEFAPGSGILHESHHNVYNNMKDTVCYSVYPSSHQTSDDPLVSILKLDHEVPICESISPVSSYRFHSMTEEVFDKYIVYLMDSTEKAMLAAEQREGIAITTVIAHHSFLNPLVMTRIKEKWMEQGKAPFKLVCFVHGTALKMFSHEKKGIDPEYPLRFFSFMINEGIFGKASKIDVCATISNEQLEKFLELYEEYPRERLVLSQNGYSSDIFKQDKSLFSNRASFLSTLKLTNIVSKGCPDSIKTTADKVVVFCGKFADWKRLETVLGAAKRYEEEFDVTTLIIGSGPAASIKTYHQMAYEKLALKQTYFLGPLPQSQIAAINSIADIGVYPSRNEPFGLVLIECLGCGTPVIGVRSGGPKDFVTAEVGSLIPECEGVELEDALYREIKKAFSEDWKKTKGQLAYDYATSKFSIYSQCDNLLQDIGKF